MPPDKSNTDLPNDLQQTADRPGHHEVRTHTDDLRPHARAGRSAATTFPSR
ncbi:hypothetical protein [Streptomyces sp. NPDC055287]